MNQPIQTPYAVPYFVQRVSTGSYMLPLASFVRPRALLLLRFKAAMLPFPNGNGNRQS